MHCAYTIVSISVWGDSCHLHQMTSSLKIQVPIKTLSLLPHKHVVASTHHCVNVLVTGSAKRCFQWQSEQSSGCLVNSPDTAGHGPRQPSPVQLRPPGLWNALGLQPCTSSVPSCRVGSVPGQCCGYDAQLLWQLWFAAVCIVCACLCSA